MLQPSLFAAQSLLHEGQRAMTSERLLNMYAEAVPGGRQPVALRSVPGLIDKVQAGGGAVRAMLAGADGLYIVAGGTFSRWDGASLTELGVIVDGPATMARNTVGEIAVVAGGQYWIWDGTSIAAIPGTVYAEFGSVDYVDGYFVTTQLNGQRHSVSNLNNGKTLDALDFAAAEYRPDNLSRVISNGGIVWMMGESTIEPWNNTGGVDYPLTRIRSTITEKGLTRTDAAARMDNQVFWHGSDHSIYRTESFTPIRVSTHAVDASLEAHQETSCFTYQWQGHDFFVVRFPDRPAWVYDPATQAWHERRTGVSEDAWNVTATAFYDGNWYAGTRDGYLCAFGGNQDQGAELRREAISRNAALSGERFTVNNLDIRCEVGTGGKVVGSFSRDGGRTWSHERERSLGAVGHYDQRVQWRALGRGREFAARVWCTDDVSFAIYGGGVDISA